MMQRTVERFRKRVILIHWLHASSFFVLLITGALMFFNLTDFNGGQQIRFVHKIAAGFFVIVPAIFSLAHPKTALSFLKDGFRWERDDITWLKLSLGYYFGAQKKMPLQDRINGDQKLWQLMSIISGIVFTTTGITLWFFKMEIPVLLYQWVLLVHAAAFIVAMVFFLIHFYLRTLYPGFEESLSSMLDGRVSESYARKNYSKWYDNIMGKKKDINPGE